MDWTARVTAAFAGRTLPQDEVLEELAQHAADLYQAARAGGRDAADAERLVEAQIRAWAAEGAGLARRAIRSPAPAPPSSSGTRLAGLWQDARYAMRLLRRQPGYAAAAIGTIALGIAATTVIVSVLYGVLIKPLPWPGADRLVRLAETRGGSASRSRFGPILTNATFRAWRDHPTTIDDPSAWRAGSFTLTDAGAPQRVEVAEVTASLFPLLGARAQVGTLFQAADEKPGPAPCIVISNALWHERFGGSASVLGRVIRLDGREHRVVGVMAADFPFPTRETRAWVPFFVPPVSDGETPAKNLAMFRALARLRPGATPAQAAAEGTARARHAEDLGLVAIAVFGSNGPVDVAAVPLLAAETAEVRPALLVFLAAVGLLLATATANVASLQLARAANRRREIAIRAALGAGTARLARQFLVESTLLGLGGGALGVAVAAALTRALPAVLPADFPRLADVTLGMPVLGVALAVSLATGLAFGVWPAFGVLRVPLVESLSEDGLAPVGAGIRLRTARARALVMILQLACACVLLIGAALLTRSFGALLRADRGYDPHSVLTAALPLPDAGYTGAGRAEFATRLLQRVRTVPGVRAAAITATLPLTRGEMLGGFTMQSPTRGTITARAAIRQVSPGYFEAMGVRVAAGRGFRETDTGASQPVVLVNRSFAKQYLDGAPLGQRLPSGEIVGIVEDVRQRGVTDATQPEVYMDWAQMKDGLGAEEPKIVVRTAGDPRALVGTLRSLLRAQDPTVALDDVRTMDDRVSTDLARPRLYALLLGGFAACAAVIAAVGLFGVLSYTVAQRAREIGIRSALGARPGQIVGLVVRQGLGIGLAGTGLGLVSSFALLKYLSSLLYGVSAYDAWSYLLVVVVLLLVTAVACALPARRAAAVHPLRALRP